MLHLRQKMDFLLQQSRRRSWFPSCVAGASCFLPGMSKTTADILFFCLSILFASAFSEMGLVSAPSIMVKAIFLYLGIKTLVTESKKMSEFAVGSVLAVLLIVVSGTELSRRNKYFCD
ncbi:hypothetical protein [Desulfuromonas sp. TF]|uniref:hypothetical protein n=1 Tax=Desulfuromonas sp. TF TaxID=1232410 RepID=UPI000488852C|nr:hypothetical protein [Desulfuromonas sp. TF]